MSPAKLESQNASMIFESVLADNCIPSEYFEFKYISILFPEAISCYVGFSIIRLQYPIAKGILSQVLLDK